MADKSPNWRWASKRRSEKAQSSALAAERKGKPNATEPPASEKKLAASSREFRVEKIGSLLRFDVRVVYGDPHFAAEETRCKMSDGFDCPVTLCLSSAPLTTRPKLPSRATSKRGISTKRRKPSGRLPVATSTSLRFVVQKHAASHLHFDLRLEVNGVFKSWAVTKGPSMDPALKRLAVEVEDHPLDYGDFEGTIPKGQYGGGTVQLWDRGYWTPVSDPNAGLTKGELKFSLSGKRLKGSWVLVRLKNDRFGGKRTNWLLIKHRDQFSNPEGAQAMLDLDRPSRRVERWLKLDQGKGNLRLLSCSRRKPSRPMRYGNSNRKDKIQKVSRDKHIANAAKASAPSRSRAPPALKEMPLFIPPQLCKLVDRPSAAAGWAHEVKFDGYRAQLRVQGGEARIRTRSGLDWD